MILNCVSLSTLVVSTLLLTCVTIAIVWKIYWQRLCSKMWFSWNRIASVVYICALCLSVAEPPAEVACVTVTKIIDIDTYFYKVNADHSSWPDDGFCRVITKVEINDGEPHKLTIKIMNVVRENSAVNSGHPGVMCNFIDENKFDAVYFHLVLLLKMPVKYLWKNYLNI